MRIRSINGCGDSKERLVSGHESAEREREASAGVWVSDG
jgi:hypothetical protein